MSFHGLTAYFFLALNRFLFPKCTTVYSCLLKDIFATSKFFLIDLFFIEGQLLYKILLFSVKPQHESAIGVHTSPPF